MNTNLKFLVIAHVIHKHRPDSHILAYGPYVREMNLWFKHVKQVRVIAPMSSHPHNAIDLVYKHNNLEFIQIPGINFQSVGNTLRSLIYLPLIMWRIFLGMCWANHIHLRCPGNIGLLGCITQILFPWKAKTAKYAGNWDWKSKQPLSYRLQKRILRNTWLTHNMQALIYGEWPDRNRNILPFFTASYTKTEKEALPEKSLLNPMRLIFAGSLSPHKRPMLAAQIAKHLSAAGHKLSMTFLGEGPERKNLEQYIKDYKLEAFVQLLGNVDAERVKSELKKAHFLIFLSKSEGWPKAVAEAMFWGCVPITTSVSCVPYMLGDGRSGALVDPDVDSAVEAIESYLAEPDKYNKHRKAAAEWSQQFTLERFEREIAKLLQTNKASARDN